MIAHSFRRGKFHASLEDFFRSGSRDLQVVLESHIEHPVIYYFHSEVVSKSFPRMLFLLLEVPALLGACLDPEVYGEVVDSPDLQSAKENARHVLGEVLESLQLRPQPAESPDDTAKARARREQTYADARLLFAEKGIALRPKSQGLAQYLGDRQAWEAQLAEVGEFLGYDWQEISGGPLD